MKQALGLVEVSGLSTAVVTADTMVKAANINILGIENTKGLGYITIKVTGDVGAVTAAVQAGRQIALTTDKLVSWKVIPRPADYVETVFCKTESMKVTHVDAVAKAEPEMPAELEPEAEVEPEAEPEVKPEIEAEAEPGEAEIPNVVEVETPTVVEVEVPQAAAPEPKKRAKAKVETEEQTKAEAEVEAGTEADKKPGSPRRKK